MSAYVGRLAPSPTGALHLGNVRTFMIAWLRARSQGGKVVFRMEDLDHPKDKPAAAGQAVEDLRWLGFDWDEEHVQSRRTALYRAALESLRHPAAPGDADSLSASPLAYPCVCSRKDVEAAQSAPHAGEQLHYPGTCRGRFGTWEEACAFKAAHSGQSLPASPCWRFRVPERAVISFDDAFCGPVVQDVSRVLGDFPLAREASGAGYTLACTVDDLLMGVTEVVRGDDLLAATPAQILLAQTLLPRLGQAFRSRGAAFGPLPSRTRPPAYLHVPLVVGADGRRLAKRHGDTRIARFREGGMSAQEILGLLAASCGWAQPGERVSLPDLIPRFDLATIPRQPFVLKDGRLGAL